MHIAEIHNSVSFEQLELRYWYQYTSFKHLILSLFSGIGYYLLLSSQNTASYLANGFLFLSISSFISFFVYLVISSDANHSLYYQNNLSDLNTFKLFEYSLSAPITILSYCAMIPITSIPVQLMIYGASSISVLMAGAVNSEWIQSAHVLKGVATIAGVLSSLVSFGGLLYFLVLVPVSSHYILYSIILLFIVTRIRYFVFFLSKNADELKYVWIDKRFVNLDLNDRIFLLAALFILTLSSLV